MIGKKHLLRNESMENNKIENINVCIWGLGYLGYSNIVKYTNNGINIHISNDGSDKKKYSLIKKKDYPSNKLRKDFEHNRDSKPNYENIIFDSNQNLFKLKRSVHILCNPDSLYLDKDSSKKQNTLLSWLIKNKKKAFKSKPIFIIEFTSIPGSIDNEFIYRLKKEEININKDYYLIFSPRKDWRFNEFEDIRKRPYWTNNNYSSNIYSIILSFFEIEKYQVKNLKSLEIIANLESSITYISNILINQLSHSYQNLNFFDITKDFNNIYNQDINFSPIGSKGIRLPNASLNLLKGSYNSDFNTILKEAIHRDFSLFKKITSIVIKENPKNIGILGLGYYDSNSYEGLSPSFEIYKDLQDKNFKVALNDPNVVKEDYNELKNINFFDFPKNLNKFDVLILSSDDLIYRSISWSLLYKNLSNTKTIIDASGIWKTFPWEQTKINYILIKK